MIRSICLFLALGLSSLNAGAAPRVIDIKVTTAGYEPDSIEIAKDEAVQLRVTRMTDITCAKEIVIPEAKINQPLPLNKAVLIDLKPLPAGKEYRFGCHMDMMISGKIRVGSKN